MESGSRKILVYRPSTLWLATLATVVAVLVAAYLSYDYGRRSAGDELQELQEQRRVLEKDAERLEQDNRELQERIAVLERSSEIDRRATLEVRSDFAGLQEQLAEVRRELAFYRSIVSPGEAKAGLRIQEFRLEPGVEADRYLYSLTLVQVKRNERYVRGVVEINVEGLEDGMSKVLPFSQLIQGDTKVLNFKFRYFQHFEGEIRIPANFEPRSVNIRLAPRGKGQPPAIEETMEWPA